MGVQKFLYRNTAGRHNTVSYTHLDVYKRQEKESATELYNKVKSAGTATVTKAERKEKTEETPLLYDLTTVSYTHLIVLVHLLFNLKKEVSMKKLLFFAVSALLAGASYCSSVGEKIVAVSYTHLDVYKRQV